MLQEHAQSLLAAYADGERDFYGWNLAGAHMEAADLREINLMEAILIFANLRASDLRNAFLIGADLEHVNLEAADPQGACLAGSNLASSMLRHAKVMSADLSDAD